MLFVCPPFEFLKKLTEFCEIYYGLHAIRGDPNFVMFNFMVLIYKKEDKKFCHNYRKVAVLSCLYEIYNVIVTNKMQKRKKNTEVVLIEEQHGPTTCKYLTFIMRQVIEKYWEFGLRIDCQGSC